jgi:TRAP-type mannitol/chloroaromatic compound transport system permease small subunit
VLIFLSSLGFVGNSWGMMETSGEPGGIPAVYLLKSLIPAMAVLLALQSVAELIRSALVLAEPNHD